MRNLKEKSGGAIEKGVARPRRGLTEKGFKVGARIRVLPSYYEYTGDLAKVTRLKLNTTGSISRQERWDNGYTSCPS
jgi:hypothetical protein